MSTIPGLRELGPVTVQGTFEPAYVRVVLPGEPHAQGRPRAVKFGAHVRLLDPKASRRWKAVAVDQIRVARGFVSFPEGPLQVDILALFSCPRSDWRKTRPVLRRRHAKAQGDVDNLAKACLDAATTAGLWFDDAQVARLVVEKWIGAQGEEPYVQMIVRRLL